MLDSFDEGAVKEYDESDLRERITYIPRLHPFYRLRTATNREFPSTPAYADVTQPGPPSPTLNSSSRDYFYNVSTDTYSTSDGSFLTEYGDTELYYKVGFAPSYSLVSKKYFAIASQEECGTYSNATNILPNRATAKWFGPLWGSLSYHVGSAYFNFQISPYLYEIIGSASLVVLNSPGAFIEFSAPAGDIGDGDNYNTSRAGVAVLWPGVYPADVPTGGFNLSAYV